MKATVAIALTLTLASSAWADEPPPAPSLPSGVETAPMRLSEAEMGRISAGGTVDREGRFTHTYNFGIDFGGADGERSTRTPDAPVFGTDVSLQK